MPSLLFVLALSLFSAHPACADALTRSAYQISPQQQPGEPGVLAMLGCAGVAGALVFVRPRRRCSH
jgi:hypothetical protein